MNTPPSPGHGLHADGSSWDGDRLLKIAADERVGVRRRAPIAGAAVRLSPTLRRDDAQVHATWISALGRCELIVVTVPPCLQVKQSTWHNAGGVVEEVFVLHGREEFQQWHASSPARFDHPVAHDEIRRFANAHLPE